MNARSSRSDEVLRAFIAVVILAFVFCPTRLIAQDNTSGAVFGRVQAGSAITAVHEGMGFTRSAVAATDGTYRIASLPPGTYKVTYTDASGTPHTRQIEVTIDTGIRVDGGSSDVLQLDKFVVGSLSINPVDFSQTTSVSIYTDKQLELLPVGRSTTEIALLAPGTVSGDSTWGLPSFGGASIAENSYFLNGFNVTSFFRGLGGASIPFEFYNQFEVNTGAYSAEFGRSTGGVINATSKSGSNQFRAGANAYYWPDAGRANLPDVYYTNATGAVVPYVINSHDYSESTQANIWASGPLWKNKLFFFGLHQWRHSVDEDILSSGSRFNRERSSDPFWAAKIDFIPFQNHHFEYTGMDTSRRATTTQWNYSLATEARTSGPSTSFDDAGGKTHIGRYTGTFLNRLTLSALVGRGESNRSAHSTLDNIARVDDARAGGSAIRLAGGPNSTSVDAKETRKALRLDADYAFTFAGSHRLRVGWDQEHNITDQQGQYTGGAQYRYETVVPGATLQGGTVPAGVTQAVRRQIFRNGGFFKVNSDAWYAEDNWTTLKNRLVLRLGVRSESFENLDKNQQPFIALDNQLAPRIGAAYDLFGNQKTKVFANYGRYHLPIATNVNVSQAGAEYLVTEWFALSSVGSDFQPVLGAKIGDTAQTQAGIVRDQREITDQNIKPMYQDEWVIGVQHAINKKYKVGVRGIARDFGYAIDDMLVNHALVTWARANGYPNYTYSGPSSRAYVLANAGRPIVMNWDFNKNGVTEASERAVLTPEMLGYPRAERHYYALELSAEKVIDEKWGAQFSYTWAHNYGNYEGLVHSDSNQSSTSLTRLFDTPDLTRNTFGDLPNDRRHQFKLLGNYLLTRELTVGLSLQLLSGRPRNKIGLYNDAIVGTQYGPYYLLQPRGTVGRTPWQLRQDLTLTYRPRWISDKRLTFSATVFNVLNRITPTEQIEFAQTSTGAADVTYGLPNAWLSPRSVRLSARFEY
jgi:hypothetical protein